MISPEFERSDPVYVVRVRPTAAPLPPMFLWGSDGITQNVPFAPPLVLHIHNDQFGDPLTFGVQVGSGTAASRTSYGTLQPGERVSISVQSVTGVYATCPTESIVHCSIKGSP